MQVLGEVPEGSSEIHGEVPEGVQMHGDVSEAPGAGT